jgi:hypothetical protein
MHHERGAWGHGVLLEVDAGDHGGEYRPVTADHRPRTCRA